MSLESLGQKIKQKYPEYGDIPDKELGARIINKYPEYKDIANERVAQPQRLEQPNKQSGAGRSFDTSGKTALEIMGGTAGSMFGPRGTVAGAAVGNIMGQLGEQNIQLPLNMPGVYHPGKIPEGVTPKVDFGEAMKEGAVQGALDYAGGKAVKALAKPIHWATETIKPEAKKVAESFSKKWGGQLTYGEQTKSFLGDVGQNIAEKGAFSGETMRKFHETKQAIPLKNALNEVANDLVGSPNTIDAAGDILLDSLKGGKKLKQLAMSKSYKRLDDLVGQNAVNANEKVIPLLEEIIETAPSSGSQASKRASDLLDLINKEYPDGMIPWWRADIEQSTLFDIPTAEKQMFSTNDNRLLKKLRGTLIDAMSKSAKNAGDDVFDLWKSIRKQYSEEMTPYNARFIRQIARTEGGENIFKKIFSQRSPEEIRKLRALVPEDSWRELQAAWLKDNAETLINPEGLFDLRKFLGNIRKMGDSYDAIFSGTQKESIDELANAIKFIGETGTAGKTGGLFIQMKQAGALTQLGSAAALGGYGYGADSNVALAGAGIILGGPWVLAKVITNPTATRYFTRALTSPSSLRTKQFMEFASKLAGRTLGSQLVNENKEINNTPEQYGQQNNPNNF